MPSHHIESPTSPHRLHILHITVTHTYHTKCLDTEKSRVTLIIRTKFWVYTASGTQQNAQSTRWRSESGGGVRVQAYVRRTKIQHATTPHHIGIL